MNLLNTMLDSGNLKGQRQKKGYIYIALFEHITGDTEESYDNMNIYELFRDTTMYDYVLVLWEILR